MEAVGIAPALRRGIALAAAALMLAGLAAWQLTRPQATLHAGAVSAVQIFASIEGTKTGKFKGDSKLKAHADETVVLTYGYGVVSPRDAASGLPTGKRMHKPLVITKEIGAASPQILNALSTNENLKTVVVNFWKTDPKTGPLNTYRVTLTNGSVSEVRQYTANGGALEDVSFTFQRIRQEDLVAKTVWEDSWEAAVT
jgi:type VI secretion system secreted protein Hcp